MKRFDRKKCYKNTPYFKELLVCIKCKFNKFCEMQKREEETL
nr:MAG: hypothetical protein [Microviridae sp.]